MALFDQFTNIDEILIEQTKILQQTRDNIANLFNVFTAFGNSIVENTQIQAAVAQTIGNQQQQQMAEDVIIPNKILTDIRDNKRYQIERFHNTSFINTAILSYNNPAWDPYTYVIDQTITADMALIGFGIAGLDAGASNARYTVLRNGWLPDGIAVPGQFILGTWNPLTISTSGLGVSTEIGGYVYYDLLKHGNYLIFSGEKRDSFKLWGVNVDVINPHSTLFVFDFAKIRKID